MNRQYNIVVQDNSRSTTSKVSMWCTILLVVLGIIAGIIFAIDYYMDSSNAVTTDQILEQGKAYLISTTNTPPSSEGCVQDETYGFNGVGEFYINDGCSGIFVYTPDGTKKKIGVCTTGNSKFKKCGTSGMIPDHYPEYEQQTGPNVNPLYIVPTLSGIKSDDSLTGFVDMNPDELKILTQNGNCRAGNYGFYGNNMIKVSNGCSGTFVLGPLIGECNSTSGNDKSCPIGSLDSDKQGLVLGKLRPFDTSQYCNQGDNYGFKTKDLAFRNTHACENGLVLGETTITCPAEEDNCELDQGTP